MMTSVPPLVTGLPTAPTPTTVTSAAVTTVEVAVTDVTQALQNLNRSIQTTATVAGPPIGNSVTLSLPNGTLSLDLSQLASSLQQSLIEQLTNLAQSQKTIIIGLAAGSPPTQAVLVIPTVPASPSVANISQTTASPQLPSLTTVVGQSFSATVLPSNSSANSLVLQSPILSDTSRPALSPSVMPQPSLLQSTAEGVSTTVTPQPNALTASPTAPSPVSIPTVLEPSFAFPLGSVLPPSITNPSQSVNLPASPSPQSSTLGEPPPIMSTPAPQAPQQSGAPPLTVTGISPQVAQAVQPVPTYLTPGTEVTLRFDAVYSSANELPLSTSIGSNQLLATIVATGSDGQLILKVNETSFFTNTPSTAPAGTAVLITIDPSKGNGLVTLPSSDPVSFPALPQALAALAQNDPQLLQQLFEMRVPQASDSLAGALLFLVSAFKQGNVRGWLGDDAVEALLKAGKANLVSSLASELLNAGHSSQDAIVGDWRTFSIPLYSSHTFQTLSLHVHNDSGRQKNGATAEGAKTTKVRFVIDMRLSKLGAMQIDGFFQTKQLDMILRSENQLPDGLHSQLRAGYIKAVEAVGYVGSLNFQVGRHSWLQMDRPPAPTMFS